MYRGRSGARETKEKQNLYVAVDLTSIPCKILGIDGDAGVMLGMFFLSRHSVVYAAMRHSPCHHGWQCMVAKIMHEIGSHLPRFQPVHSQSLPTPQPHRSHPSFALHFLNRRLAPILKITSTLFTSRILYDSYARRYFTKERSIASPRTPRPRERSIHNDTQTPQNPACPAIPI